MFISGGLVSGEGWSRPPGAMPSYPYAPADGVSFLALDLPWSRAVHWL